MTEEKEKKAKLEVKMTKFKRGESSELSPVMDEGKPG